MMYMRNTSTHFHSAEDELVISLTSTLRIEEKFKKYKIHLKFYQNVILTLTFLHYDYFLQK